MLLYVSSKAFPHKTFVVLVQRNDTIARIRAQLLHILYELGREDHQFRLRYKGQYLRDAYTVDDYHLIDNAIIKMVPLSKSHESMVDLGSTISHSSTELGSGISEEIKEALRREVNLFDQRERLLFDFKGLMYLFFMTTILAVFTSYWYSLFWSGALFVFGVYMVPVYTRTGGFMGEKSLYKKWFCVIYGVGSLAAVGASAALATLEWMRIVRHGCQDWNFVDDCGHQVVFSAMYFSVQGLILLVSSIIVWILLWNFKLEVGDYVEKYLVQTRDIDEVIKAAKSGKVRERRTAAFELACMAASGDDNKFRIVAEGGLEVLNNLALSQDEATKEHAVETIAELLTVPAIQDSFVEMGGMKTLTALLHSSEPRTVKEAASALSYMVSESEENQHIVVQENGLEDLSFAAHTSPLDCQRVIAGILLELAFTAEIRSQMAAMNTPAQALIHLCKSADPETQRFSLQTLELLAIESSDMICAQTELLEILLSLPFVSMDEKLYLIAGKILLYYAENTQTCELLLDESSLRDSLGLYAKSTDPILQKVVIKIIFCLSEIPELRSRVTDANLEQVLQYIQDTAADRDVWDMADQGIQVLRGDSDLLGLSTLSTAEKIGKMDSGALNKKSFGSRTSLRSSSYLPIPGSSTDSDINQKGLN